MARGRARVKSFGLPAMSIESVVCGSSLICLALFTIICGRLLDIGDFRHLKAPLSTVPFSARTDEASEFPETEQQGLTDVPGEGDSSLQNVWDSKSAESFYGCSAASHQFAPASSTFTNGYIEIEASGGLNQQRTGITDSVVVARILNATLVVPELDHASFWHDSSNFSDIFDTEHFISVVARDVRIVKELPAEVMRSANPLRMRVPRKSLPEFYEKKVLPKLRNRHVLRLTKFDYRLANKLEDDLQKLRCRVNYRAIRFSSPIAWMGEQLVDRLRRKGGRYIAVHLRFEPDMLAFSGCYYGGGPREIWELGEIRKRWRNLPEPNPERARRNGKCPLSPLEVGLLLRATGFGEDTNVYVASGEVYGGDEALAPLNALFPNFYTKESLTAEHELRPFQGFSSRMAAIDYVVCDESDVFVANNNGNMARMLAGHRRFSGHKRTIRPNARKLSQLFPTRGELGWERFAERVRHVQKGFMGDPYDGKPGRGDFHENPAACICRTERGGGGKAGKSGARESVMGATELEEYMDSDGENARLDAEDVVHTGLIDDEILEASREDAELEAKLEAVEA